MAIAAEMRQIERVGLQSAGHPNPDTASGWRVLWLFLVVTVGVLAKWFFEWAGAYLQDTSKAPVLPSTTEIIVRLILSLVISGVIFLNVYEAIKKATKDSFSIWFIAFQNGFFFQALIDAVTGGFVKPGS